MIHLPLFGAGVLSSVLVGILSITGPGDDKRGIVAFPFMMFAAAAVAHYIGL